jgi:hypothetical protein
MRFQSRWSTVVVMGLSLSLAGCGQEDADPMEHASISECPDDMGYWARVSVTNQGDDTADYEVVVAYVGENGDQRDTSVTQMLALAPGQSTTNTVGGFNFGTGTHDCVVASVSRVSR